MICVSIARGRHRHVIAEHRHLVQQGAKLIELRLDYIDGEVNLKRLLNDRPSPVVVTCRRERDGGKFNATEEQRLMLLRGAIAEGVEYIDLEDDVASMIPRYGKTKRIISLHDYRKTPDDLEEIHARLTTLDADVIKIATTANQSHDNLRMLQLIERSKVPTVGICMGDIGTPSRILAGRFGAPFTFATFHHERTLAPGQLSYQQMTDIYHYDRIDRNTIVFGVIGDPIGHSLSPMVHNAAFRRAGINAVYVPFRVPREHLNQFLEDAPALGIRGLSITIPHKEAVLKKLTSMDNTMAGIGAANTLMFGERGKVVGSNTDYQAALDSLEQALMVHAGRKGTLDNQTALVLGAGGAAKAIAFGMKQMGAQVVIAGRTNQRAQQLADALKCKAVDWLNRYSVQPDVLINCTPVGMHPNVDATPYDKHHLRPSMVVFDTVYNPENTLLVKDARSQSCTVVTGVEMFVRQACLQFKLFTSREAPSELMREVLKRTIGPAKY
ncbi:MAG TPA: shikimate dehydrogenase [Pirellulales bacterium]|jgi:3-dehydroquinate dehydratase/shikimate dehydrogenase|nr:shikimate dehydrogenase [Pirellulales bacterium]